MSAVDRLRGWAEWLAAAAVGIVVLAIIRTTVLPGVGFWDTAEAQTVPPILGTMHPTGFPAYVVLGWLASVALTPFGEPALRMNLFSAILVAMAAGGTVLVTRRLGVPLPLAAAAGLGLAATPIAWRIGTSADAHALHLALVVAVVLLLLAWERRVDSIRDDELLAMASPVARNDGSVAASVRSTTRAALHRADWWLVAAAAVFGVAAANHTLTLLLVVPVALFVLAVDPRVLLRPRTVILALAAGIGVTTLLYLQLPLRAGPFRAPLVYGRPETWDGFWYVVLAEQFRGSIVEPFANLERKAADLVAFAGEQLGPLLILVPAAFLATLRWAPRYAVLSGAAVAITAFFSVSYQNADIGRYYLGPAFFVWTWLAVLGAVVVQLALAMLPRAGRTDDDPRLARGEPVLDTPPGGRFGSVVALVLAVALLLPTAVALPDRQAALDRSGQTGARAWLDAALRSFEADAVVVSWWSYSTTLWYGQHVEGQRPDVRIVDDRTRLDEDLGDVSDVIDAHLGRRPVYLIRASDDDIAALRARYELEPLADPGNVFRVVRPVETGG